MVDDRHAGEPPNNYAAPKAKDAMGESHCGPNTAWCSNDGPLGEEPEKTIGALAPARGGAPPTSQKPEVQKLTPLMTVEPHGVNAVADEEWVEVDVKIDSGATETVIPESMLEGVIDVSEGRRSKEACSAWWPMAPRSRTLVRGGSSDSQRTELPTTS